MLGIAICFTIIFLCMVGLAIYGLYEIKKECHNGKKD
jgi:hypothetical protein